MPQYDTSKKNETRITGHKNAIKRRDLRSLPAAHTYDNCHTFNWKETYLLARAQTKHAREFKEAWYTRKNAQVVASLQTSCKKSVHKLSTSCVRTACSMFAGTSLNKLLTTCNKLDGIIRLVRRLFEQVRAVKLRYNKNVTRLTKQGL